MADKYPTKMSRITLSCGDTVIVNTELLPHIWVGSKMKCYKCKSDATIVSK